MVRALLGGSSGTGGRAWTRRRTARTASERSHDGGRRSTCGDRGAGASVAGWLDDLPPDPRSDRGGRAVLDGEGPAGGIAPGQPEPGEGPVPVLAHGEGGAGERGDVVARRRPVRLPRLALVEAAPD